MNMEQIYFWKAWYSNTTLSEYNGVVESPFNMIDKAKLIQFGLEGLGKVYKYSIVGGVFDIGKSAYTFSYCGVDINQRSKEYRNILQFKDAEACIGLYGKPQNRINKHTFGWVDKIDDLTIKILYEIPVNGEQCFLIEIGSDTDRVGKFTVYKNGTEYLSIHASVKAGTTGKARITL